MKKNMNMTMNEYQEKAMKTAVFPTIGERYIYPLLGLNGEVGELTEKIKKVLRDKNGNFDEDDKRLIVKELGDILWYIAVLSNALGVTLQTVGISNIEKLKSRLERGKINGAGDER